MPLYSYHCKDCDKDFELLVTAAATAACPSCGNEKLDRLMSLPAARGKTKGIMKAARAQAAREGHLSNFSKSER